jgi:hypothetical protein
MYAAVSRGAIGGGFERGFLGFAEVFSLLAKANPGNDQRALTNGTGNATLWAATTLFRLAELGYGYGEHRGSHDGDDGQA